MSEITEATLHHEIAHLSRVELLSPKPQETEDFFTKLLGMYVTHREGQSTYLRGYEDPYQWSLKITESAEPGMGHMGLRTTSAAALERRLGSLRNDGNDCNWIPDGQEFGYGKTFAFKSADGHDIHIMWEAENYEAPPELTSKIVTRKSRKPLQGMPVKRLDHLNLMASDVGGVRDTFERNLGFRTTECVMDGDTQIGAWMSSNILGHEVACMRDMTGGRGRLHHLAFFYGNAQHNIDAAEMFREYDIEIEAGPDTHGITQGQFLYVFEPGGNRIELFGEPGFLHLQPDLETKIWQMSDIDTGLAIGGTKLPWETYFTYGTPSPLPLAEHREKFAGSGPGAAPPENAEPEAATTTV